MIPIFQWMAWGNIFKYAGEILVANEFHNLQLTCFKNGKCGLKYFLKRLTINKCSQQFLVLL